MERRNTVSDHAENNPASVRVPIVEVDEASSWSSGDSDNGDVDLHLMPAEEEESEGGNGLGHHGDPELRWRSSRTLRMR